MRRNDEKGAILTLNKYICVAGKKSNKMPSGLTIGCSTAV